MDQKSVKELCELINRAHDHPLCILLQDDNSMIRYHSSHSSLTGDSEHMSSQVEAHDDAEVKTEALLSPGNSVGDLVNNADGLFEAEPHYLEPLSQLPVETVPIKQEAVEEAMVQEVVCDQANYERATPIGNHVSCSSPIPKHLRSDPLFESLCKHVREEDLWAVDLKYVEGHPERGNVITPRGATYLFVAHHKFPECNRPGQMPDELGSFDEDACGNTAEVSFTTAFVDQ